MRKTNIISKNALQRGQKSLFCGAFFVSILLAFSIKISEKTASNYNRTQSFLNESKKPKTVDIQGKTANPEGLAVFLFWHAVRDSNPIGTAQKPCIYAGFLELLAFSLAFS